MGKNNKNGPKGNVFKVAGAKSLKKSKAKTVSLGLKNAYFHSARQKSSKFKPKFGNPVKYQRQPGSRRYINYTEKQLQACLTAVKSKKFTLCEAADFFDIPCSTIKYKLSNKPCSKPGKQTIFSPDEEEIFAERISTLSYYGFPLTNYDIKMVIRDYLISQDKAVPLFKDNMPGKDWLKFFFDRHQDLCKQLESKFDKIPTQISEKVIFNFIAHVRKEIGHIPPENIFNYDEICFHDDGTRKVAISRRGTKYPEAANHSFKPNYSIMFCGNALGKVLPPFITYKTEPDCSTWTENGPEGAHYNSTSTGWMDMTGFERWFTIHLLPYLKKRNGEKVLVGDDVSSPISGKVLTACKKYNIRFLCLPRKTANILQPLHFAYFQPLRLIWNQLLIDWKTSQFVKNKSTELKSKFPFLINKAIHALPDTKENLVKGFEKTGIYPINFQKPLSRLPRFCRTIKSCVVDESFSEDNSEEPLYFQEHDTDSSKCTRSKSDLEYTVFDTDDCLIVHVEDSKDVKPKVDNLDNSSEDEVSRPTISETENIDLKIENIDDLDSNVVDSDDFYFVVVEGDERKVESMDEGSLDVGITVGDHIIVRHGTCKYPGKVLAVAEEGSYVHCMKKWKSAWRWPANLKVQLFSWEEVLRVIEEPKLATGGGYTVPELVNKL